MVGHVQDAFHAVFYLARAASGPAAMTGRIVLALVCALTQGPASAEIYKSLGPDGKVMYSNLPPASKHTPVAVLKSVDGAPAPAIVRTAGSAPQSGPRNTGAEILAPDVVGAVANVMGMSHLISSARDFCVATMPASLKRYSNAALAWQLRNADVVAKKNRILSMSDRNLIAVALSGDMARMTEDMMRPIRQSGTAEKIKWCDTTIEAVDHGVLDLVGRASIAPLMNYSLR